VTCTCRLLEAGGPAGAPIVVLRCGEQGAIVVHRPSATTIMVPAVQDVDVVDVTVGAKTAISKSGINRLLLACYGY